MNGIDQARALLDWHIVMGIDETIAEHPVDNFAPPEPVTTAAPEVLHNIAPAAQLTPQAARPPAADVRDAADDDPEDAHDEAEDTPGVTNERQEAAHDEATDVHGVVGEPRKAVCAQAEGGPVVADERQEDVR